MKTDIELLILSIKHWEHMIESMKWLIESDLIQAPIYFILCTSVNLKDGEECRLFDIIGEDCTNEFCPLCFRYAETCFSYFLKSCPLYRNYYWCNKKESPWKKVIKSTTPRKWVDNAEQYMLPALRETLKKVKEAA